MLRLLQSLVARLGRLLGAPRRLLASGVGSLQGVFQVLVAGSFCWFAISSLWIYPHCLSYANELVGAGGPVNLPKHLLGSSGGDWGEDLRYLKWWMEDHAGGRPVYVSYYSYIDPPNVGIPMAGVVPRAAKLQAATPPEAWCAVSANLVQGCFWTAPGNRWGIVQYERDYFLPFRQAEPDAHAGYSIPVFGVAQNAEAQE